MKNHMNSPILQLKNVTLLCLTVFALSCPALLPNAQAVSPTPDGGYAGGNTAEGQNALLSLTTGLYNTGVGLFSLLSLTDGQFCTGIGAGTLLAKQWTEIQPLEQQRFSATPSASATSPTERSPCLATGRPATTRRSVTTRSLITTRPWPALVTLIPRLATGVLQNNIDGDSNTAVGAFALFSENATGGFPNGVSNNAIGRQPLTSDTTGSFNEAMGVNACWITLPAMET